jgi:hypothetical protein
MFSAPFNLPYHSSLGSVALPDVHSLNSPFNVDAWGDPLRCSIPGLPEHVSLETRTAVEGVVIAARCVCGGRSEAMLDLRNLSDSEITARLHRTIDLAMRDTPAGKIRRWARAHRECEQVPLRTKADRGIIQLAHSLLEATVLHLESGSASPAGVYVLLADRRVAGVPWPRFEDEDEAYAAKVAAVVHGVLREHARRSDATITGGVAVRHGLVPLAPDHFHRVMEVSAVSSREGLYCVAELDCDGEVLHDELGPLNGPCPLLDGLLATG